MITETLERRQTLGDIESALASEPAAVVRKLKHCETAALHAADGVAGDDAVSDDKRSGSVGKRRKVREQLSCICFGFCFTSICFGFCYFCLFLFGLFDGLLT